MNRFLLLSLVSLLLIGCSQGRIKLVKVGSLKKERTSFAEVPVNKVNDPIAYRHEINRDILTTVVKDNSLQQEAGSTSNSSLSAVTRRTREESECKDEKKPHFSSSNSKVLRSNGKKLLSNSMIYLSGFGMLLLSFLGMRVLNKKRLQLTTWAVRNKKATLGISIATNFALAYTGYEIGSLLNNMNFSISENVFHVGTALAGITLAGMVAKSKLTGRGPFAFLTIGNQLGMMTSSISLLLITTSVGNNKKVSTLEAPLIANFVDEFRLEERDEPCDELVLNDGKVLLVEILSESDNSIRYKDCGVSTLTVKSILISDVKEIRYDSGHSKEDHTYENNDTDQSGMTSGGILALYIVFAIILTLLFAALSCAAICAWGSAGLLVLIALVLILVLYNWGMSNAYSKRKRAEGKIN